MKSITVVGAGFSGLTLAYYLDRYGFAVTVIEKARRPGGLISTETTEFGLVESAANALLSDASVEKLFTELNLTFAQEVRVRKNRYIYWRQPRRWPVSLWTTLKLIGFTLKARLRVNAVQPRAAESVRHWARRVVGAQFEERLLTPALQGVYAGDTERMSAGLTVAKLLRRRSSRPGQRRGSVAPMFGMGELMNALHAKLASHGVQFQFGQEFDLPSKPTDPVALCTSAWAAERIVRRHAPALADILKCCESLPLISVTAFFEPHAKDKKGFGCLFPESQGFHALGVLFNECIFAGRSNKRSETWIFGGARHRAVIEWSDSELLVKLADDRSKLTGHAQEPLATKISRWPQALPHYTVEWEKTLAAMPVERPLFLHGNYLGTLGLAEIHQRSIQLAKQLRDFYAN